MYTEEDIITKISMCEHIRAGYDGYVSFVIDKFYDGLYKYGDTKEISKNKLISLLRERKLWNESN